MAIDIGELRGILTLQDSFSKPIQDANNELGAFGKSFNAVVGFAGLAAAAVASTTAAVIALGIHGSDVADVKGAFQDLSARAGESADVMLGKLQQGTLGTISNFELMKTANTVLSAGLVTSAADMGTLAAGAKLLADRTGGETTAALETLSEAMAKGTSKNKDLRFMFEGSDIAVRNYAASLGKNVKDLNDHEKQTAITKNAMANLRGELAAAGPASADFGDNINKAKVAVQNLVDDLAESISQSPVVAAGMKAIEEALVGAFGGKQADMVTVLMGWVNKFAIGLTYVGQAGTTAASVLVTAWFAVQTVILGIMTAIAAVGTAIVGLVAGLADMASKIPGLASSVEGFASGAASLRDNLAAATVSLADQTAEAAKGVVGQSALQKGIDNVSGALINIRGKMEAAQGSQALLTKGAEDSAPAHKEAARAIGLTAAEMDKLRKAANEAGEAVIDNAEMMRDRLTEIQGELTQAHGTGIEQRLAQINADHEARLAELQGTRLANEETYNAIALAANTLYGDMAAEAVRSYEEQAASARQAGDTQMSVLQRVAETAKQHEAEIVGAVGSSEAEKADARNKAAITQEDLDKAKTELALNRMNMIAGAATTILKSIFGKNKAAMIAAVVIETAAAVITSFKNAGGFPWGLIPAAAMAATGIAQIAKIRSADPGFALGTPGTSFVDFGRGSMEMLHGPEAVVTKAQGQSLAAMVSEAMEGAGKGAPDPAMVEELRGLRSDLLGVLPGILARSVRDVRQLSPAR